MAPDGPVERAGAALRTLDLGGGRLIVARHATHEDVASVVELYGRLSHDDLGRRFFAARIPPHEYVEQWISPGRAGVALVAEALDGDEVTVVGEAGYALLADGDGELAITIDPAWRGGLGAWLLDVLLDTAAARDVPNLHADVLLTNRPMLAMLGHRRSATAGHPDVGSVRLVLATSGGVPGWAPRESGPRLLVEGLKGYWWGEQLARDAGFDVRICAGPDGDADRCPVLCGADCPLVDGADVVLSSFRADDPLGADVVEGVRRSRPDLAVTELAPGVEIADVANDVIEELRARVDEPRST